MVMLFREEKMDTVASTIGYGFLSLSAIYVVGAIVVRARESIEFAEVTKRPDRAKVALAAFLGRYGETHDGKYSPVDLSREALAAACRQPDY
ncbi:hypothetical protein FHS78_000605 [Parvibaculum indicum]|uniref:hypothetical protein n=1 Tax=Parvibaculum indicum TaxID=562969 RepID=UPI00141F668E|nr:hypothetical protein [Parvibaculum indicum]NIJ40335.1 hypothetical protein [Parvibaculum indicum]